LWLSAAAGLAVLGGCFGEVTPPEGLVTTFIIIRHAERDPGADPPLIAEGFARAETLKNILAENGVTAIYATDLLRNRQTVAPIAEELGLTPTLINPARYVDTVQTAAEVVSQMLTENPGGTILFCGNIGSVLDTPGIMESLYFELGGTGQPPTRYEDMIIVTLPADGAARFIKTGYGGPSSLD
jgi:hypothetical protein